MADGDRIQLAQMEQRASVLLKSWSGVQTPYRLGTYSCTWPVRFLTLAPGEWLATSDAVDGDRLYDHLQPQAMEQGTAIANLSDGFSTIEVRGPAARALLSKGCGLDFHPRFFPVRHCTRTRFAQLPVILVGTESVSTFELKVARSLSAYLLSWLNDLAVEYRNAGANQAPRRWDRR